MSEFVKYVMGGSERVAKKYHDYGVGLPQCYKQGYFEPVFCVQKGIETIKIIRANNSVDPNYRVEKTDLKAYLHSVILKLNAKLEPLAISMRHIHCKDIQELTQPDFVNKKIVLRKKLIKGEYRWTNLEK